MPVSLEFVHEHVEGELLHAEAGLEERLLDFLTHLKTLPHQQVRVILRLLHYLLHLAPHLVVLLHSVLVWRT